MFRTLLSIPLLTVLLTGCTNQFKIDCEELGGIYREDTTMVTSTTIINGKVGITTTPVTIKYCIKDGEVVMVS